MIQALAAGPLVELERPRDLRPVGLPEALEVGVLNADAGRLADRDDLRRVAGSSVSLDPRTCDA